MRDIYIEWRLRARKRIIQKLTIVTLVLYVLSAIGSDVVESDSYTSRSRTTSLIRETLTPMVE